MVVVSAPLAPIPPSISPPGAGNEYEYALKTKLDRAKKAEKGYVDQAEVVRRHLDAASIRPNHDGDMAAIPSVEQAHLVLHAADRPIRDRRCWASVAAAVKPCPGTDRPIPDPLPELSPGTTIIWSHP